MGVLADKADASVSAAEVRRRAEFSARIRAEEALTAAEHRKAQLEHEAETLQMHVIARGKKFAALE
jgi:hypothetical protein